MDNTRTVEKLIILLDYTEGVLARLYHATQFVPGEEQKSITSELRKFLLRDIPNPTDGVWELESIAMLQTRRDAISRETKFVYDVFEDLYQTGNEICAVVKHVTNTILTFDLESNGDIVIRAFDLLSNFTKMHLLASRISIEARLAVLLHSVTAQQTNNTQSVRKLLYDLNRPYAFIRSQFDVISCQAFAPCLTKQAESFSTWMNFEELKKLEMFSWDPPQKLAVPFESLSEKIKQVLSDAQHVKDLGSWVFALSVTFPQLLRQETMQYLLKLTITDRHYDVLFRDEKLDFKQEVLKSIKSYHAALKESNKDNSTNLLDLSLIQKMLKTNDVQLEQTHLDTQTWLTLTVKDLLHAFSELPGAIAPKLQIVVGILHKIKHEIWWTVVHCSSCKENDSATKFWRKFCHIPELLHNAYKLSSMVLKYKTLIYDYYAELLDISALQLSSEFEQITQSQGLDGDVKTVIGDVMQQLTEYTRMNQKPGTRQYSHVRLDCYRVQWHVSVATVHSQYRADCESFMKKLKKLCDETRFADSIETELRHCNPFKLLWYYPNTLQTLFSILMDINTAKSVEELQAMKFNTAASRNISKYWNIFLRICEYAIQNVHHEFGNEQEQIGLLSIKMCEQYIRSAAEMVKQCLNVILSQKYGLGQQISTDSIGDLLIQMMANPYAKLRCMAGAESYQTKNGYCKSLLSLNEYMTLLSNLLYGFSEINSIIVFDQIMYPNAYLHDIVKNWFQYKLKVLFKHQNRNIPIRDSRQQFAEGFLVPTKLFEFLTQAFVTLSAMDQILHIDVGEAVKQIIFDQFYLPELDRLTGCKPRLSVQQTGNGKLKLIEKVCNYYMTLLEHAYVDGKDNTLKAVYSPYTLSWVSNSGDIIGQSLQDFCSLKELEALCSIIGVHGVRSLDHQLLQQISKSLAILISNVSEKEMFKKIFDTVSQSAGGDGIKQMYFLTTHKEGIKLMNLFNLHAFRIGAYVQFRKLLQTAMNNVCDERAAFEKQTVEIIQNSMDVHDVGDDDDMKQNRDPDGYASLNGGDLRVLLRKMMHLYAVNDKGSTILKVMKEQFAKYDSQLMENIIMFMSISFLSQEYWNKHEFGRYDINIGNYKNNGVALAECVWFLFEVFYSGCNDNYVREKKLSWMRSAIDCISMLVNFEYQSESAANFVRYPHASELLLFLELFVEVNKEHLYLSDLETRFDVYDLIRAQSVKLCGEQCPFTTYLEATREANEVGQVEESTTVRASRAQTVQKESISV